MASYKGTAQMYLQEKSQDLKAAVKRIYFHLVENEEDTDFLFAFLATYATKDVENRIVHMPLKHALIEYKNDQKQLLDLLSCLNDVAQKIDLIAKFMETGDLFHPIRLTSKKPILYLRVFQILKHLVLSVEYQTGGRRNILQLRLMCEYW